MGITQLGIPGDLSGKIGPGPYPPLWPKLYKICHLSHPGSVLFS